MTNDNNKSAFSFDTIKQAAENIRSRGDGETLDLTTGSYKVHALSSERTRFLLNNYGAPLAALLEGKTPDGQKPGVREWLSLILNDLPGLSTTIIEYGSDAKIAVINTDEEMILAGAIIYLTFIAPAAAFSFFGGAAPAAQPESVKPTSGTGSKPASEDRS